MRITKEPEERKQEILDTAMRIFYEKGYEKTSITDIAKAIGVAQGLCYRYFPSKEALFDSAIDQYANELVSRFSFPSDNGMTLKQIIETMPIMAGMALLEPGLPIAVLLRGIVCRLFTASWKRMK